LLFNHTSDVLGNGGENLSHGWVSVRSERSNAIVIGARRAVRSLRAG
jgi:hypothetical protein